MHPPVDYPVDDDVSAVASAEELTYAALLDRHASQLVITDAMIQSACSRIEAAQQLPNAAKPEPVSLTPSEPVLTRLINAIR